MVAGLLQRITSAYPGDTSSEPQLPQVCRNIHSGSLNISNKVVFVSIEGTPWFKQGLPVTTMWFKMPHGIDSSFSSFQQCLLAALCCHHLT